MRSFTLALAFLSLNCVWSSFCSSCRSARTWRNSCSIAQGSAGTKSRTAKGLEIYLLHITTSTFGTNTGHTFCFVGHLLQHRVRNHSIKAPATFSMIAREAGAFNATSIRAFANGAEGRVNYDHLKYYQLASKRINASHTQGVALELNHQL